MTYGGSFGGAMALTMAWFRTERYHRVLSYSGTFVDLREGPRRRTELMSTRNISFPIRRRSRSASGCMFRKTRKTASAERRNWVIANQRLAGVLKAKSYHYQFVYSNNKGHVDAKVISQTLPQALEYVWRTTLFQTSRACLDRTRFVRKRLFTARALPSRSGIYRFFAGFFDRGASWSVDPALSESRLLNALAGAMGEALSTRRNRGVIRENDQSLKKKE